MVRARETTTPYVLERDAATATLVPATTRMTATTTRATTPPPPRRTIPAAASTPVATTMSAPNASRTGSVRTRWNFSRAFTIGRSRRSDVVVPTTAKTRTVSKLHARIFPVRDATPEPIDTFAAAPTLLDAKPTRWVLQDLEAMNGTSLNGVDAPTGGSMELHDGDELVLASTMRHGARLVISFLHDDCSTVSLSLDMHHLETPVTASPLPSPSPPHEAPQLASRATRSPTTRNIAATRSTASPAASEVVTVNAAPPATSVGFLTPPPVPNRHMSRHTSSTVATKRERHHRDRDSAERQQRSGSPDAPMEDVGGDTVQRKRSRRLDALDDQDRCMLCPICFEYFHASVTLPCSHTFCGLCVTSWFRASLTCPQCRSDVTSLPVRNRALDDLVHRLVGETPAYKTLVAKRLHAHSSEAVRTSHAPPAPRNPFDSEVESRAAARRGRTSSSCIDADTLLPNVYTRWKQDDIVRVRALLSRQFGEQRLQTCRRIGLTETSMQHVSTSQTAVAMQNLLLDWWPYDRVRDEGNGRLQIFLHFG